MTQNTLELMPTFNTKLDNISSANKGKCTFFEVVVSDVKSIAAIKLHLKGFVPLMDAIKNEDLEIDEFATSAAMKIQVALDIYAGYFKFRNLSKNILDKSAKVIKDILELCEEHLQKNKFIVHADEYYLRFSEMQNPLNIIQTSLMQSLTEKAKQLSGTDRAHLDYEQKLFQYYSQQLLELIKDSLEVFKNEPLKEAKHSKQRNR